MEIPSSTAKWSEQLSTSQQGALTAAYWMKAQGGHHAVALGTGGHPIKAESRNWHLKKEKLIHTNTKSLHNYIYKAKGSYLPNICVYIHINVKQVSVTEDLLSFNRRKRLKHLYFQDRESYFL